MGVIPCVHAGNLESLRIQLLLKGCSALANAYEAPVCCYLTLKLVPAFARAACAYCTASQIVQGGEQELGTVDEAQLT